MAEDFPGNSQKSKAPPEPRRTEKKVERVSQGEALRRKKPVGRRIAENFGGTDARSVWSYVFIDVMIPAVKDMVADATSTGVERMLFGDSRAPSRRARSGSINSGPSGIISYNRYGTSGNRSSRDEGSRDISRRGRSVHDFDEIILPTRVEAEEVVDRLFELVDRYESASVADLYELVGIEVKFTDNKWGWTSMRGSGVSRVRNGYLLNLPKTEALT